MLSAQPFVTQSRPRPLGRTRTFSLQLDSALRCPRLGYSITLSARNQEGFANRDADRPLGFELVGHGFAAKPAAGG